MERWGRKREAECCEEDIVEYLIYLPPAPPTGWLKSIAKTLIGTNPMVTVDLSASSGKLHVEWFNPRTGKEMDGGSTNGGGMRSFSAPFTGDAVLYLHRSDRS